MCFGADAVMVTAQVGKNMGEEMRWEKSKTPVFKQQRVAKSSLLHALSPLTDACGMTEVKLQHQHFGNVLKEQHEMASLYCVYVEILF